MKSTESDLAELRDRVARLEARLNALTGQETSGPARPSGAPAPAPIPPRPAPADEPPPLLVSPTISGSGPGEGGSPRAEISSSLWVAGAGAVIFLVGAFYGLTVAIQRGWISPLVRVGTGLAVGAAVGIWAARMIQERRGLGVAFLAVGVGTWSWSLFYGSQLSGLFPQFYGLAGTVLAVIACGLVAARVRSDGAMAVALATGLVAPLAFSTTRHELPTLLGYLAALSAAQLGVHLGTKSGEDWPFSRLLGTIGLWLAALVGMSKLAPGDMALSLLLLPVLLALGLAVVWLPGLAGRLWAPGAGSVTVLAGAAAVAAEVWRWAGLGDPGFAVVLTALAFLSLGSTRFSRRRVGDDRHERPLLVAATVFLLVAARFAWDWRDVAVAWGIAAVALAWLARRHSEAGRARADGLQVSAVLAALAASALWFCLALVRRPEDVLFFNRPFAGGVLAAAGWGVMAAKPGPWRPPAFVLLQLVAVNALAWELARGMPPLRGEQASLALGRVLATLTYAVAGAWQWLRGVQGGESAEARGLRAAGYAWLAVAVAKLFLHDLSGRNLVLKAVAALAVGAVFLGVALWANRRKRG